MRKIKPSTAFFIFLSLIVFLSLVSYDFRDVFYPHYKIRNFMGLLGVYISNFSLNRFGLFAYYIPVFLLLSSFSYNKSKAKFVRSIIFGVLVMFFGDILLDALYGADRDHLIMNGYFNCGVFGYIFGDEFKYFLGDVGIFVVIVPIWMLMLYFSFMEFFSLVVERINDYERKISSTEKKHKRESKINMIKRFVENKIEEKTSFDGFVKDKNDQQSQKEQTESKKDKFDEKNEENIEDESKKNKESLDENQKNDNNIDKLVNSNKDKEVQNSSIETDNKNETEDKPAAEQSRKEDNKQPPKDTVSTISIDTEFLDKKEEKIKLEESSSDGYQFPSVDLLKEPINISTGIGEDEIYKSANILKEKLKHFGVDGEVVNVKPGPVITMYEFRPKSGIKISKISNLYNDLAMAMKAMSVRIIAPIPGKAVVGIEISNQHRQTVYMKDILESKTYAMSNSKLTLALGKDIVGNPFVADLSTMPHMLIAGATGSGKSVSVNTMILSILYKATPDEVKFVMIDPKMLELSIYEGIPHMLMPVVVDPKEASGSLAALVSEMETRYRMMSEVGVRNIAGFNEKAKNGSIEYPPLPYIVVVIDELADLMMVAGKKVETHIARLAQMARAAGIHMIVATQRPSVDVLTGLIKANFPARISFKVSSKIDSRTILDMQGAEALLGRGDMLFMQPGSSALVRIHGAFVGDDEIKNVTDFVKAQGEPEYNEELINATKEASGISEDIDFETDEMFDEALRIIQEGGNPTISYIQRRLKIGYNRAARIIEQMEKKGILSKPDERNRREILI